MPIDLKKYIDNSLRAQFHAKPFDPSKGRSQLLAGIKRTMDQLNSKTPVKAPNKWFKANGDLVELTVKLGNVVIPVEGEESNIVPRSQVVGLLTDLGRAVEAGDFDADIKAALSSPAKPAGTRLSSSGAQSTAPALTRIRRSVGKSLSNGRSLDEIEAALKAAGEFSVADIDTVIAEKK